MGERVGKWMVFTGGLVLFCVMGFILWQSASWLGLITLLAGVLLVAGVSLAL